MNVLSLFDGMSCGRIALDRLGIKINNYFASEVDKHAVKVSSGNYPGIIHLGDVRNINPKSLDTIDLLIGGSPCQSFSFAGKQDGMTTKCSKEILTLEEYISLKESGFEFIGQSYLFWEYVRILTEVRKTNPNVKFLLENVVMIEKWEKIITKTLGVKPILINSELVSAQSRKRLYWTNIENVKQPDDKNINLQDILEDGPYKNKATIVGRRINKYGKREESNKSLPYVQCIEVRKSKRNKSNCLTTVQKDNVLTNLEIGRHEDVFNKKLPFRYYTVQEACRLQTVPDYYFENHASDNQAKKMLGNGWTVDVIVHILKGLQ